MYLSYLLAPSYIEACGSQKVVASEARGVSVKGYIGTSGALP